MMVFRCHPGRSRRRLIGFIAFLCAAMFVACGDDNSDFATRPSDGSSSSVCEDCDDESSSSVTPKSSDSETSVSSSSTKSSNSSEYARLSCDVETEENCFEDTRDGQTYKTVKIGDQVWMAENLNYETDNSFCYNDSAEYCEKYGRLYTWAAAMDSAGTWSTNGKGCGYGKKCDVDSTDSATLVRGVCPEGWHLPSHTEWYILFMAVRASIAGTELKSTSGWYDNGNGTDDFGFSALPAGLMHGVGHYYDEGDFAYFWSSTEGGGDYAYDMYLFSDYNDARLSDDYKDHGFSVRCLKD